MRIRGEAVGLGKAGAFGGFDAGAALNDGEMICHPENLMHSKHLA